MKKSTLVLPRCCKEPLKTPKCSLSSAKTRLAALHVLHKHQWCHILGWRHAPITTASVRHTVELAGGVVISKFQHRKYSNKRLGFWHWHCVQFLGLLRFRCGGKTQAASRRVSWISLMVLTWEWSGMIPTFSRIPIDEEFTIQKGGTSCLKFQMGRL